MTTQYDPPTLDDYNDKWKLNYKLEGFGVYSLMARCPCPFCAEPDFMTMPMMHFQEAIQQNHTCGFCGRSSRTIVSDVTAGLTMEVVQTGGDVPPTYLPTMRRVDNSV